MDDNDDQIEVNFDERQIVSLVSKVITDSCLSDSLPIVNRFALFSLRRLFHAEGKTLKPCHTGSSAEFYIRPVIPCIHDVDVMYQDAHGILVEPDNLQFPEAGEIFEEIVSALKLIPVRKFPGYVRLQSIGYFKFDCKFERYVYYSLKCPLWTHHPRRDLGLKEPDEEYVVQNWEGPAVHYELKLKGSDLLIPQFKCISQLYRCIPEYASIDEVLEPPFDEVKTFLGPFWPTVAEEWKQRVRRHGWPSKSMIEDIVDTGCHVVHVAHPNCREDKNMHRLSFSRAEVILIRSWKHVQQVVYHMLRFFAKQELMRPNWKREDKILCNYHIKTLMLWSCESECNEFWEQHVVDICCILLGLLADSLKQKILRNYFIPECNLYNHICNEANRQVVIEKLKTFETPHALGHWFYSFYILKSAILKKIAKEYSLNEYNPTDITAIVDSFNRVRETLDYTVSVMLHRFIEATEDLLRNRPFRQITALPYPSLNRQMAAEAGHWFTEYITAMQMLHVVKYQGRNPASFDTLETFECIAKIFKTTEVHKFPDTYKQSLSERRRYFIAAQDLMTGLMGQNTESEVSLLIKLAVLCLQRSLNVVEKGTDHVSMVYIAALKYFNGEPSVVKNICSQILNETQGCRKSTKQVRVEGRLLLFIDDVANVLGFLSLHRYICSVSHVCSNQTQILRCDYRSREMVESQVVFYFYDLVINLGFDHFHALWRHVMHSNPSQIPTVVRFADNGRCIQFDDCVPNVFGFITLFRYVSFYCQQCRIQVLKSTSFTPGIIAQLLLNLCAPESSSETLNGLTKSPTIPDQCLMSLTKHKSKKKVAMYDADYSRSEDSVVKKSKQNSYSEQCFKTLLMDVFLEKLTKACDLIRYRTQSNCIVDYFLKASYLFRCGKYDSVLPLCDLVEGNVAHLNAGEPERICSVCCEILLASTIYSADIFFDDNETHCIIGFHNLLRTIYFRLYSTCIICRSEECGSLKSLVEDKGSNNCDKRLNCSMKLTSQLKYVRIRCMMETNLPKPDIMSAYRTFLSSYEDDNLIDWAFLLLIRRRMIDSSSVIHCSN